jgi:hypothetical protein
MEQPPSTFKADEEKSNVQRTNKEPQCMKDRPLPDAQRQPLTDEQTSCAKSQLINKNFVSLDYPRTLKFRVDPRIPSQSIGLVSFIPSKGASPDPEGCFGVLKLRGNFPTVEEADNWSENLIRNYDSFGVIDMVHIGRDFPIMVDNEIYTSTTREIDVRKKVDDVTKSHLKAKQEEERKEMKEIQERQQKLLNPSNNEEKEQSLDDLDYYIQLKVKKANADMVIDEANKKKEEARTVSENTATELSELDQKFPDYQNEYMQRYQNALASVGADANKNPLIDYMRKQIDKK